MNVQELNEFFKELDKINKQVEEDYYGKKYDGRGKKGIWEEDEGSRAKKKETEVETETRKETFEDRIIKMRLMPIVLQFGKEKIITNLKEIH